MAGGFDPRSGVGAAGISILQARKADLKWRLESGMLQKENEALESQVRRMQEDFFALQEEIRQMKDRFGARLNSLGKALESQQTITSGAERRVICTEDLVRFYDEQRRLMAGHWKAECQRKDEKIRALNLQLTEYTTNWQQLGAKKQTEASLSHEMQCLQDRHDELSRCFQDSELCGRELCLRLATECLRNGAIVAQAPNSFVKLAASVRHNEVANAQLRKRLRGLEDLRNNRANGDSASSSTAGLASAVSHFQVSSKQRPRWCHSCIWKDELDVRDDQLRKITEQWDRMNGALHAAQKALAQQRDRHEAMKIRHRDAEAELREGERSRARWQQQCMQLRQAHAELLRAAQLRDAGRGQASSKLDDSPTRRALPGRTRADSAPADCGSLRGMGFTDDLTGVCLTAAAAKALPLQERIAAISRETQRLVALRHGAPPDPAQTAAATAAGQQEERKPRQQESGTTLSADPLRVPEAAA